MTIGWSSDSISFRKLRQIFPEELAPVDHLSGAHVKQIHREHPILVVIAEHVGIVAFGGGDALALLQLRDRRNEVAISRRALILLYGGSLLHTGVQRPAQIRWPSFEKQVHVAHRLLIRLRRGQLL